MVNKPGWLSEAIAKPDGYYTEGGEKLKGVMLTPAQVAEWNGTAAVVEPDPAALLPDQPSSASKYLTLK